MQYIDFELKTVWCEDEEQYWFYAAYNFVDDNGDKWIGKSPVYKQYASDLYCLHEDAVLVSRLLSEGAAWEDVSGKFRQAW